MEGRLTMDWDSAKAPVHQVCAANVIHFLACVLVCEQALRLSRAANVDADGSVPETGHIGVRQCVALEGAIALAIGKVLKNRGNRTRLG